MLKLLNFYLPSRYLQSRLTNALRERFIFVKTFRYNGLLCTSTILQIHKISIARIQMKDWIRIRPFKNLFIEWFEFYWNSTLMTYLNSYPLFLCLCEKSALKNYYVMKEYASHAYVLSIPCALFMNIYSFALYELNPK